MFQETVWQDTEVGSKFLTPLSLPTHRDLQPCLIYSRCQYLLITSSSFYQDTGIWGTRSFVLFSSGLRDRAWLTVGTQCSTCLVVQTSVH